MVKKAGSPADYIDLAMEKGLASANFKDKSQDWKCVLLKPLKKPVKL